MNCPADPCGNVFVILQTWGFKMLQCFSNIIRYWIKLDCCSAGPVNTYRFIFMTKYTLDTTIATIHYDVGTSCVCASITSKV